jgi:hypothetical protein
MIVWHGTTTDCLPGIQAEGLHPGSFVAPNPELARNYSHKRALDVGAEGCVLIELDVPDAAVTEITSWWWTGDQLVLPAGCPASCIVSVDHSDPRPFQDAI